MAAGARDPGAAAEIGGLKGATRTFDQSPLQSMRKNSRASSSGSETVESERHDRCYADARMLFDETINGTEYCRVIHKPD